MKAGPPLSPPAGNRAIRVGSEPEMVAVDAHHLEIGGAIFVVVLGRRRAIAFALRKCIDALAIDLEAAAGGHRTGIDRHVVAG